MTGTTRARLGDRLLERGLLTQRDLEVALAEQRRAHRPLGEILVSLGFVEEADIAALLAADLELEFLRASDIEPSPELVRELDEDFVHEALAFPYALEDGVLRLVMVQPDDPERVSRVRERYPFPLDIALTTERDLYALLRDHAEAEQSRVARLFSEVRDSSLLDPDSVPVESITRALLIDALQRGATDLHIEPEEHVTRVRYRVDGVLQPGESLPAELTPAVVSRIKVLSHLDISERRRPQDGRFRFEHAGRTVDLRVSLLPGPYGENAVLRLLDSSHGALSLGELGLSVEHQGRLVDVTERTHGIFLVTGPTGAGKTTTLYSLVARIDGSSRKVATIEDPIEIRLPLVRQSQVDPGVGYGFEAGLRALLRQDPDVLLVGEVRDGETAELAVRAAMTGHLVFATLHANSARGAVPRLLDLGVEHGLLEDTLVGALGQRLVRTLCAACRTRGPATRRERDWMEADVELTWQAVGCARCGGTGFRGRTAIAELWLPGAGPLEVARGHDESGFEAEARRVVREGRTTVDEVLRVQRPLRLGDEEQGG